MSSYAGFHGQAATNKHYLKLTFQWDLLAFFARCLLVAERMDEVKGKFFNRVFLRLLNISYA